MRSREVKIWPHRHLSREDARQMVGHWLDDRSWSGSVKLWSKCGYCHAKLLVAAATLEVGQDVWDELDLMSTWSKIRRAGGGHPGFEEGLGLPTPLDVRD